MLDFWTYLDCLCSQGTCTPRYAFFTSPADRLVWISDECSLFLPSGSESRHSSWDGIKVWRKSCFQKKKKKLLSTSKTGVVIGRQFTFSSTGCSPPRFLFRILKEAPSMAFLRSSDLHCPWPKLKSWEGKQLLLLQFIWSSIYWGEVLERLGVVFLRGEPEAHTLG